MTKATGPAKIITTMNWSHSQKGSFGCKLSRNVTMLSYGDHLLRHVDMPDDLLGVYAHRPLRLNVMTEKKASANKLGTTTTRDCDPAGQKMTRIFSMQKGAL
jgi:hypothetical protein